jgi:hypothetical protein
MEVQSREPRITGMELVVQVRFRSDISAAIRRACGTTTTWSFAAVRSQRLIAMNKLVMVIMNDSANALL